MDDNRTYTYYAFISYNHRDERIAKWLQLKLEHYRLPAIARKELGKDVKIRPVFRYAVNLALCSLRDQIKRELEASKYLIVICSPNSAKPNIRGEHWVNDEVKHFIEMNRKDRIIPVIAAGEPNTGDERECFPPALRDAEISAANLFKGNRSDRRNDFLKIVAKLLDILPDQLIRHAEEEERHLRRRKWMKVLPLALFLAFFTAFIWDGTRQVTKYYADYVDNYGLPEGILEQKTDSIKYRRTTWRFDFKGYYWFRNSADVLHPHGIHARGLPKSLFGLRRKLIRVVRINSLGVPVDASPLPEYETQWPQGPRPTIQDFRSIPGHPCWDSDGRLQEFFIRKRGGNDFVSGPIEKSIRLTNRIWKAKDIQVTIENGCIQEFIGTTDLIFYPSTSFSQGGTMPLLSVLPSSSRIKIAKRWIDRDYRGRTERIEFRDSDDRPAGDPIGVYGFEFELDREFGRITHVFNLGQDNYSRAIDQFGCDTFAVRYDENGLICEEQFMGKGKLVLGRPGYKMARRKHSRMIEILGEGNRPAAKRFAYQDAGGLDFPWSLLCQVPYSDCSCSRIEVKNGIFRSHVWYNGAIGEWLTFEYSPLGDLVRLSSLAIPPCQMFPEGLDSIEWDVDPQNGFWKTRKTTINGNPAPDADGVAEYRREVDSFGRPTRIERYDGHGHLIPGRTSGTCMDINEYDNGHLVKQYFFDAKTNVCSQTGSPKGVILGCWKYEYGSHPDNLRFSWAFADSNCNERVFFDGKQCGFEFVYDERGRMLETWAVDANQRRVTPDSTSVSGWKWEYRSLESSKEPVVGFECEKGCIVVVETQRNPDGSIAEDAFGEGISQREIVFETPGKPICWRAETESGDMADIVSGSQIVWHQLDDEGNSWEAFRYGKDGTLATNAWGIAGIRHIANATKNPYTGQVLSQQCTETTIGLDGKPFLSAMGFSTQTLVMDWSGSISWSFWHNGKPCQVETLGNAHRVKRWNGPVGIVVDVFDLEGKPMPFSQIQLTWLPFPISNWFAVGSDWAAVRFSQVLQMPVKNDTADDAQNK